MAGSQKLEPENRKGYPRERFAAGIALSFQNDLLCA